MFLRQMSSRTALETLQQVFGYPGFRAPQAEIIDLLVGGGDALVIMPTGGGKSLCYQIPALLRQGTGVVISPLIALMQDQVGALNQLGIRAAFLNSSLSLIESRKVESQLRGGGLDLLYVAPERLLQERTLELLDEVATGSGLALFAIDEAHCVSQWGHDFRPEYLRLKILGQRFPGVPRLACTATADERTRAEIRCSLGLQHGQVFISGFDRPNIRYRVTPKSNPRQQLLAFLKREHAGDSGIVYCLSRRKTEQSADFLRGQGFTALPYHAGLDSETRRRHQDRFLREDGLIICATIAFGMGIDKPDLRFVAHLDLPKSIEGYYQETGRAGRDGLPADAWMCYGLQDVVLLRRLIDDGESDEMQRRRNHQQLDAMLGFCEVTSCRRQVLLAHFGDRLPEPCGNCDTCLDPPTTFDATIIAQKALSCVARTGQRFGAQHVIDVLLGKSSDRVLRQGHERLSTFGIGGELDAGGWRSVFRQLTARGFLELDAGGYGGLRLAAASRLVLTGGQRLQLRHDAREEAVVRKGRVANAALLADTAKPAGASETALFERLRALRRTLAAEFGVPPYVVFHDRTLAEMARKMPKTAGELRQISGVGNAKLERFGAAFLDIIRDHLGD